MINNITSIIPKDFHFLDEYIIEQNTEHVVYRLPKGLINIDRELILANFKDGEITFDQRKSDVIEVKLWFKDNALNERN